jgi:hypothetical protein
LDKKQEKIIKKRVKKTQKLGQRKGETLEEK